MSRVIEYTFEDEDGINPTGKPMDLQFSLSYNFTQGCPERIRYDENDHPEEPPEIEVYDVSLIAVNDIYAYDSPKISKWFLNKINSDTDLQNIIYEFIFEELNMEYDYNHDEL